MEELLKNISGRSTFSISRNPKRSNDLSDAERLGISEIPAPGSVSGGKRPIGDFSRSGNPLTPESTITKRSTDDVIECESSAMLYNPRINNTNQKHRRDIRLESFSDFIMQDYSFVLQRKILLQQEKLQKLSIAAYKEKSDSKILSTKGLNADEGFDLLEGSNKNQIDNLLYWPQCINRKIVALMTNVLTLDEPNRAEKIEITLEERGNAVKPKKLKTNSFWPSWFTENPTKTRPVPKKKIYADPAYIIHLAILKVRDEREEEAMKILKERLVSTSLLKKTNLRSMVNELFLRALDKGFDDLVIFLMESGFPENLNYSIYGDFKSRRFPSYLLLAIGLGRLRVVQRMIEIQPRVQMNKGWFNGVRPLMMAQMTQKTVGKSLAFTQLLLKQGAEPNRSMSFNAILKGLTYLNKGKRRMKGNIQRRGTSLQALKRKRSQKLMRSRREIYRNSRLFALDFACFREKYESARLIISSKIDKQWLQRDEFCLLELEDFELAAEILEKAPELIKQRDWRGNTPLHCAAKRGRLDLVALYLRFTEAEKVNSMNSSHWTPLHEAAAGAHRATVQFLISRGADCSIKNIHGKTALQVARESGISSEELYDFFHSADTIQGTKNLLRQLVIPKVVVMKTTPTTSKGRILIQKFMRYPRKLWSKSFKLS